MLWQKVLLTSHSTRLVTTLCLKTYRRRLENVYTPVPSKGRSIMILYLVIIKLGFSLFTKKGKECSWNTQRCVFIGELLIHYLETVNVCPAERHSTCSTAAAENPVSSPDVVNCLSSEAKLVRQPCDNEPVKTSRRLIE